MFRIRQYIKKKVLQSKKKTTSVKTAPMSKKQVINKITKNIKTNKKPNSNIALKLKNKRVSLDKQISILEKRYKDSKKVFNRSRPFDTSGDLKILKALKSLKQKRRKLMSSYKPTKTSSSVDVNKTYNISKIIMNTLNK